MVRCALFQFNDPSGTYAGALTANFHTGLIDPGYIGGANEGLNSVEAGVGHWDAILYVYF
jgi:hypothetical protein